jgi:hypothetical protein
VLLQRQEAEHRSATARGRPDVTSAILIVREARDLMTRDPPEFARAEEILQGVQQWLGEVATDSRIWRFYGGHASYMSADIIVPTAAGAVRSMLRRLWMHRSMSPGQPMRRPLLDRDVREFEMGRDFFEVLDEERPYEASIGPAIDRGAAMTAEMYIGMVPVVGSLWMLAEAAVGREFLTGHVLSDTERVVLGAGALLAEVGTIVRGGATSVRAVQLALLSSRTGFGRLGAVEALRLAYASRALTRTEAAAMRSLIAVIRRGGRLSAEETVLANRLVGKMREVAIVEEALAAHGAAGARRGAVALGFEAASADERRVANALAAHYQTTVVRVTEQATNAGRAGARTGDIALGGRLAEIYTPQGSNIENVIRKAVNKHGQAGTMIIDLTRSALGPNTLLGSAGRFWGRPEFADVVRLIVVHGSDVVGEATRPASRLSAVEALIRPAAQGAAQPAHSGER